MKENGVTKFRTRILFGGSTPALVSDVSLRQISGAIIRGKIEAVQVFEMCFRIISATEPMFLARLVIHMVNCWRVMRFGGVGDPQGGMA